MLRKLGLILGAGLLVVGVLFAFLIINRPERGTTGSINTKFRLLGPSDKIVVDGFDDPKVEGVACHIARAQTGGVKGALGVAEDTSDASIACRQIGPIKILGEIEDGDARPAHTTQTSHRSRPTSGPRPVSHDAYLACCSSYSMAC